MKKNYSKQNLLKRTAKLEKELAVTNRELEIESALEKVRARMMAMQKSEELPEVSYELFRQLRQLGEPAEQLTIGVINRAKNVVEVSATLKGEKMRRQYEHPINEPLVMKKVYRAWKAKKKSLLIELEGKELKSYNKFRNKLTRSEKFSTTIKSTDRRLLYVAFYSKGMLGLATDKPGPKESVRILKRFASVFDQAYTRFLDLQKVETQAKEAQIEAAMERVRAKAMSMHKSEDLSEVAVALFREVKSFGGNVGTCGFVLCDRKKTDDEYWVCWETGVQPPMLIPHTADPTCINLYKGWESGAEFYAEEKTGDELKAHFDYMLTVPTARNVFENWLRLEGKFPGFQRWHAAYFKQGFVFVITVGPYPAQEIFKRFAPVFGQAYTRFLDLQKAEAQAREAEIEASLERVRTKTMAMHNSRDVGDTVITILGEFVRLGIETFRCGIGIIHTTMEMEVWTAKPNASGKAEWFTGRLDMRIHPLLQGAYSSWETKQEFYAYELKGEDLIDYFTAINNLPNYTLKYNIPSLPPQLIHSEFYFPEGALFAFSRESLSPEASQIFKRFAAVIGQTYRRFLDLQKAETQAREAQIEAALERVRSRSMGMQKSEELKEVIQTIYEQFIHLGIHLDHAGFVVDYKPNGDWHFWIADKNQIPSQITVPYFESEWGNSFNEAKKKGNDFFATHLKFEEKNKFYQVLLNLVPGLREEVKQFYFSCPGLAGSTALMENVSLYIENFSGIPYTDEENGILMRFGKVFQQTYTRFLDLQKAEAQAREAQIEASLERVRSKTMAMHNSNDVGETVAAMFAEFVHLGIITNRCGILIFGDERSAEVWTARSTPEGKAKLIIGKLDLHMHRMLSSVGLAWKAKEAFYQYELTGEDIMQYYTAINNAKFYPTQFDLDTLPSKEFHSDFFFNDGAVFSFTNEPVGDESGKIMKRFASVFGQTYRRYLDLQKAEAQAREAQIEAALEKVRSRTMAMQKSEELSETVYVLFQQFKELGENPDQATIGVINENEKVIEYWVTLYGQPINKVFKFPIDEPNVTKKIYKAWKENKKSLVIDLSGNALTDFMAFRASKGGAAVNPDEKRRIINVAFFSKGLLNVQSNEERSEQSVKLLERFAAVFEQTYTRFLDLQKAEAQAREATIEAALERVRAKAMAMHDSNDLSSAASMVFTELRKLGINPVRCGVGLLNRESRRAQLYSATSSENGDSLSLVGWAMLSGHPVLESIYDTWMINEDYFPVLEGEQLKLYYEKLLEGLNLPAVPDWQSGQQQFGHFFSFSIGCLYAWSDRHYDDAEIKILKRFATIIDLTFRRYLELKKSEANAREAVKQSALDRVRADIASMRTTSDLDRITPLIWNELTILGVPFIRCGVFIMDDSQKLIHTFLSTPDGKAIAAFHIPYDTTGNIGHIVDHWHNKKDYIDHWDESAFTEFAATLVRQGALTSSEQYLKTIPHGGFYLHFLPFLQGMLYVGNTGRLSEDEIKLIQSVADAFSTAYARYEDFNKLEAAKQQVDKTLVDLKQAQTQLVQSEKMASLGELTAGIAHEIQNPLNFVNNFSDVSNELLEEMKLELEQGNKEDAIALVEDVRKNLEKILYHGKRADAIVKGMLQHSRTSSGQKETMDINGLTDEYLRLAYHGLRAKDKSFTAKFETHFDQSIGKIKIIPQDIGRVILNLINNAFYAVTEKRKQNVSGYEPTVTVTTGRENGNVEIKISDNGNGIPQKIRDKIFQPFFTTKPTGQGTGLGLSLAYDIVKAHGGEITVDTKEGEGTEFMIVLPQSET